MLLSLAETWKFESEALLSETSRQGDCGQRDRQSRPFNQLNLNSLQNGTVSIMVQISSQNPGAFDFSTKS